MNKKKGFTLIELLAIIVILAIIAVITVPLILNIINDAQKNASIDSAYGYKDALEKYYITKTVKNTEYELPNGYKDVSELPEDFIVSGDAPSDGWVKLKKGIVDKFSLKYKDYVVTMDNEKNVTSEKQENVNSHVPDEYKEVEYLESTGTQYIDTGHKVQTSIDIIELDLNVTPESGSHMPFGTYINNSFYALNYYRNSSNQDSYYFYNSSNVNSPIKILSRTEINSREKIKITPTQIYKGDSSLFDYDSTDFETLIDSFLFGVSSSNNSVIYLTKMKLYNAKILNNDNMVRNFVPVVRKSDNKPGLYDLTATNLFDKDAEGILNNKYIASSGVISDSSNHFVSDYIDVRGKKNITISNVTPQTIVYCSFYDSSKEFISSFRYNVIPKIQEVPSDANYVRCTVSKTMSSNFMLNEGTEALPYEPYKKSFYTNDGEGEFITGPEI